MTKSQIAGVALALLFVSNASMMRVHAVAMSEPLYISLSLLGFIAFHRYFENLEDRWLFLTGALCGMAYLTRYAGLALLATFLVALILLCEAWQQPFKRAVIFILGALPFMVGWAIRNELVADNATNRQLIYHPLSAENISTGIYNLSEFLIPVETWRRAVIKVPNLIGWIVLALGLVILVWLLYRGLGKFLRQSTGRPEILGFTSGLYIFGYLASIFSSMLLFDASTKFKLRILSPVYVSLLVLLVVLAHWLWQRRAIIWRGFAVLLVLTVLALSASETYGVVNQLRRGGQGYASFQWAESEAMAYLRRLPEGTRIYTNQPGPVYLYTDRPGFVLPDLVDAVTGLPREHYEEGVKVLRSEVLEGKAVLALFKFGAEAEDVQTIYLNLADGLYLVHQSRGDRIYSAPP
jgi:hypothetical protein